MKIGKLGAIFLIFSLLILPAFSLNLHSNSTKKWNGNSYAYCGTFDTGVNDLMGVIRGVGGCDRNITFYFNLSDYAGSNLTGFNFSSRHLGGGSITPTGNSYFGAVFNMSSDYNNQSWGYLGFQNAVNTTSGFYPYFWNSSFGFNPATSPTYYYFTNVIPITPSNPILAVTLNTNLSVTILTFYNQDYSNNTNVWGEIDFLLSSPTTTTTSISPTTTSISPTTTTIDLDDPSSVGGLRNTTRCRDYAFNSSNGANWGIRQGSEFASFICEIKEPTVEFLGPVLLTLGVLVLLGILGGILVKLANKY